MSTGTKVFSEAWAFSMTDRLHRRRASAKKETGPRSPERETATTMSMVVAFRRNRCATHALEHSYSRTLSYTLVLVWAGAYTTAYGLLLLREAV